MANAPQWDEFGKAIGALHRQVFVDEECDDDDEITKKLLEIIATSKEALKWLNSDTL